jgi:hypothetical protein
MLQELQWNLEKKKIISGTTDDYYKLVSRPLTFQWEIVKNKIHQKYLISIS